MSRQKYNDGPFDTVRVYLSKAQMKLLKDYAAAHGLPMSRLLSIAFDNELDQTHPFNYPTSLPTGLYIEGAYAHEASCILKFLENFEHGCGRDMLMLCRRDMTILDRETFLLALRELIQVGLVEEVLPPKKSKFTYPDGYRYVVIKGEKERRLALVREKKREFERMRKELEELEKESK